VNVQLTPKGGSDETNFSRRWRDGLGSDLDGHLSSGESTVGLDRCNGGTSIRGRYAAAAASAAAAAGAGRQRQSTHWLWQRQSTPAGGDQRLSGWA
jgi:hypothetical protein